MKFNLKIMFFACLYLGFLPLTSSAQNTETDSTGFAGDHFNLKDALSLFEKAESLEAFEKALNQEEHHVNNLDLNEDGAIDYIRVVDHMEDDVHAIVLQVPLSANESQDIAVIEIEKTGAEEAQLQIIGMEEVYGSQTIIEPYEMEAEQNGNGPTAEWKMTRVIINVWAWPSVRFIYGPRYRRYVSPFAWSVYPRYWKPWRPYSWRVFRGYRVVRPHYRVVTTHRVARAHRVYVPNRRTSTRVVQRTTVVRNRNGKVVRRTKTTRTVRKNKRGRVTKRKKAVRKRRN